MPDESGKITSATASQIEKIWSRWGLPIVTPDKQYLPGDVEGLVLRKQAGEVSGLITWAIDSRGAEIVTLDSFPPGRGVGARLLEAAESEFARRSVTRVHLFTTNDNARALRFYLRHGYRLRRVVHDAMDRVRRIKPETPKLGNEGIALLDLWLLDKQIGGSGAAQTATVHVLTILAVDDLARSSQFYQRAFSWTVAVDVPVYVEFALPDGQRIGLYDREGFARNTGRAPSQIGSESTTATEIYLHCEDLQAALARIEAAGAETLSALADRPWGDQAAYFADPDGNVLVIARKL